MAAFQGRSGHLDAAHRRRGFEVEQPVVQLLPFAVQEQEVAFMTVLLKEADHAVDRLGPGFSSADDRIKPGKLVESLKLLNLMLKILVIGSKRLNHVFGDRGLFPLESLRLTEQDVLLGHLVKPVGHQLGFDPVLNLFHTNRLGLQLHQVVHLKGGHVADRLGLVFDIAAIQHQAAADRLLNPVCVKADHITVAFFDQQFRTHSSFCRHTFQLHPCDRHAHRSYFSR